MSGLGTPRWRTSLGPSRDTGAGMAASRGFSGRTAAAGPAVTDRTPPDPRTSPRDTGHPSRDPSISLWDSALSKQGLSTTLWAMDPLSGHLNTPCWLKGPPHRGRLTLPSPTDHRPADRLSSPRAYRKRPLPSAPGGPSSTQLAWGESFAPPMAVRESGV